MAKTEDKTPKAKTKTGAKPPKVLDKKAAKREEVKQKILKYMNDVLKTEELKDVPKLDIAEACGFSATGTHAFSYAWKDLVEEGKVTRSGKTGCGCLTELGQKSAPDSGVEVAAPKDNDGKREVLLKQLQRRLSGNGNSNKKATAPPDKIAAIVDVLKDGKPHHLDELCEATGWKNLSTHAFGYTMSAMKKQKLVDNNKKEYTLTDKWFPEGRP